MEISTISNENQNTYNAQKSQSSNDSFELELQKATDKKLWITDIDGSQTAFYKADEKGGYIIKRTEKNGKENQKIINANDVNPTNASSDEMYVYALNLKDSGRAGFE